MIRHTQTALFPRLHFEDDEAVGSTNNAVFDSEPCGDYCLFPTAFWMYNQQVYGPWIDHVGGPRGFTLIENSLGPSVLYKAP